MCRVALTQQRFRQFKKHNVHIMHSWLVYSRVNRKVGHRNYGGTLFLPISPRYCEGAGVSKGLFSPLPAP